MTLTDAADAAPIDLPVDGTELATYVAAKLCHDFISPSGAIVSGLDLMQDPAAQDMRDDAMALIEQSARKMVALVHYARVAFGAATTSERFTARELEHLLVGMTQGGRASLDWRIADGEFSKPQARALTNLAYLTVGALPMGGAAVIQTRTEEGFLYLEGFAEGARARLKPEAVVGLAGERLTEGLAGQWIQPYWLWLTVTEAGGALHVKVEDGKVALVARMPA
ncbi:MAG: histidine phosphotransferase family protein [Candidatus Brevundimonas colombiensis]|jgi:histidine phosphotransferase ChpT|uniref:Histidine phosphotransferase family protein n=1 Tax=Candidatus Brevundimonas colombiensis TaxID=3121376 RepID=A0AAJ6BMA2_9CAUL|nr:histidine phosphotransferase family protein [Brevundimonas sp.]WEK41077.1 MAG: histidine phosphotransferase family protein [Brevundimonas sp.]